MRYKDRLMSLYLRNIDNIHVGAEYAYNRTTAYQKDLGSCAQKYIYLITILLVQ